MHKLNYKKYHEEKQTYVKKLQQFPSKNLRFPKSNILINLFYINDETS